MFKLKVSSTNQIVMDMNIEVELFESSKPLGKNGFEATIKMNESPLFIDVSADDGSDKESYVLSQNGNDLYQHEIINENLAITEFYSSVDEYENDEYDIAFGFKFDKENGEAKKLRTIGDKWSYLQRVKFGANAQPFYVPVDNDGNPLNGSYGHKKNVDEYLKFLNTGLDNYKK